MTDPFSAYIDLAERHAASIARRSGLIPLDCHACYPAIPVDPTMIAKHNAAHHQQAKRKKPKERHRWRHFEEAAA